MRLPLSLLLLGLLVTQVAVGADHYDDDEDDEDDGTVHRTVVPSTPQEKYQARMDALLQDVKAQREACKVLASSAPSFCTRDLNLAQNTAKRRIEQQFKEDLAREAAAAPAAR